MNVSNREQLTRTAKLVALRKRSGRLRSPTESDEQYIPIISLRNPRLTAPQITAEFNLLRRQPVSQDSEVD